MFYCPDVSTGAFLHDMPGLCSCPQKDLFKCTAAIMDAELRSSSTALSNEVLRTCMVNENSSDSL